VRENYSRMLVEPYQQYGRVVAGLGQRLCQQRGKRAGPRMALGEEGGGVEEIVDSPGNGRVRVLRRVLRGGGALVIAHDSMSQPMNNEGTRQ
jgi:hypothetical protein